MEKYGKRERYIIEDQLSTVCSTMIAGVTRICYRHRVLHAYQKELAVHFYQLNWKIMGVKINKMVFSIAKYYYLSIVFKTSTRKLSQVER